MLESMAWEIIDDGPLSREVKRVPHDAVQISDWHSPLLLDSLAMKGGADLCQRDAAFIRVLELAEHLHSTCSEHPASHLFTKEYPMVLRYTLPEPAVPIFIALFAEDNSPQGCSYLIATDNVLEALGLDMRLNLPQVCLPSILGKPLPEWLLPKSHSCLTIAGCGAKGLLRRDPVAWCQCICVLQGHQYWRLLPPHAPLDVLDAVQCDLGCSVSKVDLFEMCSKVEIWTCTQGVGQILLIPPGWWYQVQAAADGPTVSVFTPFLNDASLPYAVEQLRIHLRNENQLGSEVISYVPSRRDLETQDSVAAIASWLEHVRQPSGARLSLGFPVFSLACPASAESWDVSGFEARVSVLLKEYPFMALTGSVVPEDAPEWTFGQLELFFASWGFLRPKACSRLQISSCEKVRFSKLLAAWAQTQVVTVQPKIDTLSSDTPRVIWSYWAQGVHQLEGFQRLCVHSWRVQNPRWDHVILDMKCVAQFVKQEELPNGWMEMTPQQQSDGLRLALLARYGGVWCDVGTLCLCSLDDWVWHQVATSTNPAGFGAFYYARFGVTPGESREYVENWFLAARRGHPLIVAWRDLHRNAWDGVASRFEFAQGPAFKDVDLSHLNDDQKKYLTMHMCFKKLIDEDQEVRRIWDQDAFLLSADDGPMAWMDGVDSPEECVKRWVFSTDLFWMTKLLAPGGTPLLKFIGGFAQALQWQPLEHLISRDNLMYRALVRAVRCDSESAN